jgi:hypothetical protein
MWIQLKLGGNYEEKTEEDVKYIRRGDNVCVSKKTKIKGHMKAMKEYNN